MRRVLLSAFGIHSGGGRVLLEALLRELQGHLRAAVLDVRARDFLPDPGVPTRFVPPRVLARLQGLRMLVRDAAPGDVLFCFNGLPPLRKRAGLSVVVYLQGRHLLEPVSRARYPLRTRIRIALEQHWLRAGLRHCDEMWVQTPTMAELVRMVFPGLPVRVMPFVDDALAARLERSAPPAPAMVGADVASFFYPADGVAHKNHGVLLQAWHLLGAEGCRPTLYLTLPPAEFQALLRQWPAAGEPARIVNLGPLERDQVLQHLSRCSALVFASTLESFGLPLLEARAAGVPVLAAERGFVRDVCDPRETFDPSSPRSVADAVRRFLAPGFRRELPVLSARELVQVLTA